jgi:hypothetical protein
LVEKLLWLLALGVDASALQEVIGGKGYRSFRDRGFDDYHDGQTSDLE